MPTLPGQTRTSYASGEVSPTIRAANDLGRFQTGVELNENMIVLLEAVLTRRPGTRFINELKTESQRGKMFPFRYSGSDYYGLAFNGGTMRLLKDGGIVLSAPATPFELTVPWVEADLPNLRSAPVGNTINQTAAGKPPQTITRTGSVTWSIAQYRPKNGPVNPQNLDSSITIQASAVAGAGVTLTGAGSPFTAGQVDGVFRLDEASQSIVPLWQANENIALTTESVSGGTGYIGDVSTPANAFDGNNATTADKAAATDAYVGRVVAPASTILSARVLMAKPAPGDGGTVTLQLYRKNGAPASSSDGTLLAQLAYDVDLDGANNHTLTSSDATTANTDLWVRATYSGAALTMKFAEVVLTRLAAASPPVERRWQQNVYQALTAGNTGLNAPVHTDGDVAAGTGNVTWRYLHSGYGFVQITGFTNANLATGTVLSRLPDSVTATATYRWWPPAWSADAGWPKNVFTYKQRAAFMRDDTHWMTKPTTLDNFEVTVNEDSAIARRLIDENGSRVLMRWAVASGAALIYGMHDNEWIVSRPKPTEAFSANNIDEDPDTGEGSQDQIPALLEGGAAFIGRDGKRLFFIRADRVYGSISLQEISVASRHIFGVAAVGMAWQQHPNKILWVHLADGTLASVTFMPAEKVTGWARHPMKNCFVEDMIAIPTSDNGRSDVILQTRRTINGATHRYYEQLMPSFAPLDPKAPTAAGAWFVDCGLRYQGAPATRIFGFGYLIGETLRVLADGHQRNDCVVAADGSITLDDPASDVIAGIGIDARVKDLPRGVQVQGGSGRGTLERASHLAIDVYQSAGGQVRFNDQSEYNDLTDTGTMNYGGPIPLVTKAIRMSLAGATADEVATDIVIDNCLPFTLLATTPVLEIEDPG